MKYENEIRENVRMGYVELLILKMLTKEDMYGYQIRQELDKRTGGAFQVKEGSLYGPLYRMSERKLIVAHKELVGEKRFRNYYSINESGREYLEFALREMETVFAGIDMLLKWEGSADEK
ncbi:MAG: PadR family transcriptional regulator [Clostridia bacterium]|nr:PadR family transcriptional regulator [Clostridia bacterium]